MKQQIQAMMLLQNRLNEAICSSWRDCCWEWRRAILVESAELMDHYGWKWWKYQRPDLEQVHLELVDIFHFMLAWEMENEGNDEIAAVKIANALQSPAKGPGDFLDNVELYVGLTISMNSPRWNHFAGLMAAVSLSFEDLYKWYMGKKALTMFRQDKGYQQGRYQKAWFGKEDNEHLANILSVTPATTPDFFNTVYNRLAATYLEPAEIILLKDAV